MSIRFSPISSPGASRDVFVDFTGVLEPSESLSTFTVTSSCPSIVTVSNFGINVEPVSVGEGDAAVGKGVYFTINTIIESQAMVPIWISIQGDSGTVERCEIAQPVMHRLCD